MKDLIKNIRTNLFYKNTRWCENYIKKCIRGLYKIQKYNPVLKVLDSVDRIYLEKFIEDNKQYVKGKVLEFRGTENYAHKYVDKSDITYCAGIKLKKDYEHFGDIDFFFDYEDISTFPDEKFDCIIFTQCLVYSLNPILVLSNMLKLLKSGGVILISSNMFSPNNANAPFYSFITPAGLRKCLEKLKDNYKILSLSTSGGGQKA